MIEKITYANYKLLRVIYPLFNENNIGKYFFDINADDINNIIIGLSIPSNILKLNRFNYENTHISRLRNKFQNYLLSSSQLSKLS